MTIVSNVSPTEDEPTHHLKLIKGTDTVGLIAVSGGGADGYNPDIRGMSLEPAQQMSMRTVNSPGTKYSNFERPYAYKEQITWANGFGKLYAEATPSYFYDSKNAWTMTDGQIVPSGNMSWGRGYREQNLYWPGSVTWQPTHTKYAWCIKFTASTLAGTGTYPAAYVYAILRKVGSPTLGATATLHNDSGGAIGTQITDATCTLTSAQITSDYLSVAAKFTLTAAATLTNGTDYWVKILFDSAQGTTNYWLLATDGSTTGKSSINNSTWVTDAGMYYRMTDVGVSRKWNFFDYKGLLYVATEPYIGTGTPQLFRNGWRGMADSNTADKTKLNDAEDIPSGSGAHMWNTDYLSGSVARIMDGAGENDSPNYRTVTAGAAHVATVSPAWGSTHSASTTEYIIHNTDWWFEITGHGMTTPIKSVAAPGDVIYFAQGDADPIRRGGEYNNAGTWAQRTWADDDTNYADLLGVRTDQRDGVQIIRGLNKDSANHVSIARGSAKDWGSDVQFGTQIPLGMDKHHIGGIADGEEYTVVVTEAAAYAVDRDSVDKIIDFGGFAGEEAGKAICYSSPYVYFSLGRGGFEQLQDRNMQDIGLWRLEGWQSLYQGPIVDAVAHPQHIYVAVDAGDTGYSAVYAYQGGWHQIFRAPELGQRIRSLFLEVIEGPECNRLWIGMDKDICWIPMPNVINPVFDSNFDYTYEFSVTSSWIDEEARDMLKYFKDFKVFAENLTGTSIYLEIDYQVDAAGDSSVWNRVADAIDTSPSDITTLALECKRVRYRVRGYTNNKAIPPRILAIIISSVTNIPPKYNLTITWRIIEEEGVGQDLNGDDDGQTFASIIATLLAWASSPAPVAVSSVDPDVHGRSMFVMPAPRRPMYLESGESKTYVGTLRLQEA
jgi:hypothetical protein